MVFPNALPFISLKYSDMCKLFWILSASLISSFGLMPHDRLQGLLQFGSFHAGHSCQHLFAFISKNLMLLARHQKENQRITGVSLQQMRNGNIISQTFALPQLFFGQFFHFSDEKLHFFLYFFSIHILQCTEGEA